MVMIRLSFAMYPSCREYSKREESLSPKSKGVGGSSGEMSIWDMNALYLDVDLSIRAEKISFLPL